MIEKATTEEVKNVLNKILNSIWSIVIIGILVLLKSVFFYNNTIAISENVELETIIGTASFIISIMCLICALPNRARVTCGIIVNIFLSILLFGDNVYYIFSNNFLSIAQITNLQYGEEIISTLPMVLKIEQVLYFIDIIIILVLLILRIVKIEKKKADKKLQLIARISCAIIGMMFFFIVCSNYVEKGGQKSYNKDLQIKEATIFGYHIYDIESAFSISQKSKYKFKEQMMIDYEALKEEYEIKYGEERYPFEGILDGKNVIILQLESVQEFVINKKINGMEITPNLNRFLNDNIEFTNMHMQSYSTTADSEHSTITSIYPMENGMSFSQYYTNTYDNIFRLFNDKGYHTSYMHGNYPYFWNRGNVYGRMKLDELVLMEQFDDISEKINGYLSDELLYKQAVQKMKSYENPFFSYVVAASSHTAFNLEGLQDRSKVNIDVGKYNDTFFGNYLEAINYADYAFGVFLNELKENELYDDTAILVFGDHNGLNMYNEELIDFLNYIDPNITDIDLKLNYTRVIWGLKIPEIGSLKIEKPINKLDIKPTLAYMCNLDDKFSLGTNIFKSKDFVCLNNERIITSRYYYDENWYEIKTGEMLDFENLDEDTKILLNNYYSNMKTELDISNSVSVNNLLAQ